MRREVALDRQPSLTGSLVTVRPLEAGDLEPLYAIASDPLLWEQHPSQDRTQRRVFRRWFADAMASGGALTVVDRTHHTVIGTSRFDNHDRARGEVEVGWTFLARSHWAGPYNAEMKHLMLRHAFRSVDAVVFRAHTGNVRSRRAIEKLGAHRVGTQADPHGRGDNAIFRLERAQFRPALDGGTQSHPMATGGDGVG